MSIEWKNLVSGYPGIEPLHVPFSASLDEHGLYAVVGPNGCGKSTFLKTTLGLTKPLAGEVYVLGKKIVAGKSLPQDVGFVPQIHGVNRYFDISVRSIVRQGAENPNRRNPKSEEVVERLLREWDLLPLSERAFHELSVGQKTRALVARALACEPRLLFLDEPLANLDMHCQRFLIDTLTALVEREKMTVLVVDHHFEKFQGQISRFIHFTREKGHDECEHVEARACYIHFHDALTELSHDH